MMPRELLLLPSNSGLPELVISLSKSDKSDFEWEKVPSPTGRANARPMTGSARADEG
jgi:hypothetical protein